TTTRMALDVPIVTAQAWLSTQPEPILAVAPSPSAGNHLTPARAGQRGANSGARPCRLADRSSSAEKCACARRRNASTSLSQVRVCLLSKPVPDAIERLHMARPSKRSERYSANET